MVYHNEITDLLNNFNIMDFLSRNKQFTIFNTLYFTFVKSPLCSPLVATSTTLVSLGYSSTKLQLQWYLSLYFFHCFHLVNKIHEYIVVDSRMILPAISYFAFFSKFSSLVPITVDSMLLGI